MKHEWVLIWLVMVLLGIFGVLFVRNRLATDAQTYLDRVHDLRASQVEAWVEFQAVALSPATPEDALAEAWWLGERLFEFEQVRQRLIAMSVPAQFETTHAELRATAGQCAADLKRLAQAPEADWRDALVVDRMERCILQFDTVLEGME